MTKYTKKWRTQASHTGMRLDAWLHYMLPEFSRALLQRAIRKGNVLVNGKHTKPSQSLMGEENIQIAGEIDHQAIENQPECIHLDIPYQDEHLILINKPAGLVVHPGAGNLDGTLLNALLFKFPELSKVPRAGLVHRLDKDTSGLIIAARTAASHAWLVSQLQKRKIKRNYLALCHGAITSSFSINKPIGRNPHNRTKMAVLITGKPALSHVKPITRFTLTTLIEVRLHTGRTHQIRVHLAHSGHPLVGDQVYGNKNKSSSFHRQALHATKLELIHPQTKKPISWQADLPEDMQALLASIT